LVDKPLVLRKLSELDDYSRQLGEFAGISPEEYAGNWKVQRIIERTLQMIIETVRILPTILFQTRDTVFPKVMWIPSKFFMKTVL